MQAYHYSKRKLKLAVEPAAGAVLAASYLAIKRKRLAGKRIGLVICGANIDAQTYERCLRSEALAQLTKNYFKFNGFNI